MGEVRVKLNGKFRERFSDLGADLVVCAKGYVRKNGWRFRAGDELRFEGGAGRTVDFTVGEEGARKLSSRGWVDSGQRVARPDLGDASGLRGVEVWVNGVFLERVGPMDDEGTDQMEKKFLWRTREMLRLGDVVEFRSKSSTDEYEVKCVKRKAASR